jgi:type II secretory pathway component PulF
VPPRKKAWSRRSSKHRSPASRRPQAPLRGERSERRKQSSEESSSARLQPAWVTNAGRATRGFVDADSDRSARQKLRRDGIFLTELTEGSGTLPARTEERRARFSFSLRRSIPGNDLAIATRQLATLLGAGIPLVESLGALTEQVEHTRLKSVIGQVRDRVNEGATLADALARAGLLRTRS